MQDSLVPLVPPLVVIVTLLAVRAGGAWWAFYQRKTLAAVAEDLGLIVDPAGEGAGGQVGAATVFIDGQRGEARIHVDTGLPVEVSIRLRPLGRRGSAAPTGDPAFDRAFLVEGDALLVAALLDADTRALLRAHLGTAVGLVEGEIQGVWVGLESRRIRARVAEAEALAASLRAIDLRGRLERAVMAGTESGPVAAGVAARVRLGDAADFLVAASDHPLPAVRLAAARLRGVAGVPVAAAVMSDPDATPGTRAEAIAHLARLDRPTAERLALAVLATDTPAPVVVAALTALADAAIAPPPGDVARHLVDAPPGVQIAAARALAHGTPSAEPLLLALLASRDAAVAEAAADALGRVGTLAAVGPLQARAQADDRGAVARACRLAVSLLQGDRDGGGLAVVASDAGGLTLREG